MCTLYSNILGCRVNRSYFHPVRCLVQCLCQVHEKIPVSHSCHPPSMPHPTISRYVYAIKKQIFDKPLTFIHRSWLDTTAPQETTTGKTRIEGASFALIGKTTAVNCGSTRPNTSWSRIHQGQKPNNESRRVYNKDIL